MSSDLTIIIPFLNEKEEVENTLQSIREHSDTYIPILLINDASDDGIDYVSIAKKYDATYLLNRERIGVAASRDRGVEFCQTTYFLLLDAHMRFYDAKWADRLVSLLEKDDRVLLCAQTKVLVRNNGNVVENNNARSFGAYIDFLGDKEKVLSPIWVQEDLNPDESVTEIPCVLGAGYATSKRYWQYLHGLRGLIFYSCDEAYISLKVWKEGGRCLLVKDVVIGHIYRTEAPYRLESIYYVYNKILLAELLLPYPLKRRISVRLEIRQSKEYEEAQRMLSLHRKDIASMKLYLRSISTRSDKEVFDMQIKSENPSSSLLRKLTVGCRSDSWELQNGKVGLAVTLFQEASFSEQALVSQLIRELLRDFPASVDTLSLPVTFVNGWCGIGWGIAYLIAHKALEDDYLFLLRNIDQRVMKRDPRRIRESGFDKGLAGILYYVMYRIENASSSDLGPFDALYLQELEDISNELFLHANGIESVDVFQLFLQGRKTGKYIIELLESPQIFISNQ